MRDTVQDSLLGWIHSEPTHPCAYDGQLETGTMELDTGISVMGELAWANVGQGHGLEPIAIRLDE